jgi:hypothetical protein
MCDRKTHRHFKKIVLAAIACLPASASLAGLTFNLRATSVNGAPLSGAQTQHFIPNVVAGDVIAFDVFALVTGMDTNFTNDRVLQVDGSFRSTALAPGPGLRGNLKMDVVHSVVNPDTGDIITHGFDGTAWSVGLQQDLDGDGDLDVGSNADTNAANFWAAVYTAPFVGAIAGLPDGRKVGFGTFTVTAATPTNSTVLRFVGRNAGTAGNYLQDGVFFAVPTVDSTLADSILVSTAPEPASVFVLSASVVCLGRRSRRVESGREI